MKRSFEEIEISLIMVDEKYQRSVNTPRVKRMFDDFSPACMKAISISKRIDGSLHAYDGMHTIELCKMAGHKTALCIVVDGDSESEAKWFSLMNGPGALKARPWEQHKAKLHYKNKAAMDAQEILDMYGLKTAKGGRRIGETGAIKTITDYLQKDKPRLILAMDLIDRLWSQHVDAWTHVIVRGFWEIAGTGLIDSVEQRLSKYKVTPELILATAAGMQVGSGGPGSGCAYIKKAILKHAKLKE